MGAERVTPAAVNWGTFLLVVLIVLGASNLDGLTGSVLGVIGGLIGITVGVSAAILRAKSPRERAFWAWSSAILLLLVASFAVAFAFIPGWYRFLLFLPYGIALALLIRYGNRKLAPVLRPPDSIL